MNEEADRLNRSNRLVGEGAEVARLHQMEVRFGAHRIQEAVESALQESEHTPECHPVEVGVPQDLPPVRMDVKCITEVLAQLLENAGKYSAPNTPTHITSELRKSQLITSVADHGRGIDDVEQAMIFEKFYRGRNQRVSIQGTGLGLAIAKAIVELHGGTIGVTSQFGPRLGIFLFVATGILNVAVRPCPFFVLDCLRFRCPCGSRALRADL